MKIKECIIRLQEIACINSKATIYIEDENGFINFSGISVDDNNDIRFYQITGDKKE